MIALGILFLIMPIILIFLLLWRVDGFQEAAISVGFGIVFATIILVSVSIGAYLITMGLVK